MAILRFSKWRPSAMLDSKKLQFLYRSPCQPAVLLPRTKILLKSDNRLMSYGQKSDFQDGGRSHLKF